MPVKAVAQVFYLADVAHCRFLKIDFQIQFSCDEWHNVFHRPLCAFPAFAQNQAVIRIPHILVSPALQFLVQLIQHDVGKKR